MTTKARAFSSFSIIEKETKGVIMYLCKIRGGLVEKLRREHETKNFRPKTFYWKSVFNISTIGGNQMCIYF